MHLMQIAPLFHLCPALNLTTVQTQSYNLPETYIASFVLLLFFVSYFIVTVLNGVKVLL